MTDQQKLAWAHRHGVTPPAFVLEQVAAKVRTESPGRSSPPKCCGSCGKKPSQARTPPREARAGVVLLSAQLRCQGAAAYLAVLPAALPCPPSIPWMPDDALVCRLESPDIGRGEVRFEPPDPPPRHVG
jgi:hypothetical protein